MFSMRRADLRVRRTGTCFWRFTETGVVLDILLQAEPVRVEFVRVRSLRTQQRAESQCQVIPRVVGLRICGWDSFG